MTISTATVRPRLGKKARLDQSDASFYPEVAFGGIPRLDGVVEFYSRVNALIEPHFVVVDFGCGRGAHTEDPVRFRRDLRNLKGKAAKVIGLDVDPTGEANPTIDEFRLLRGGRAWPMDGESADLVICHSVLEHLPEPASFFAEARRVLHPGGVLAVVTTNLWSYVGIAAALVPNRFHARIVTRVQADRKEDDVFPTLYRCNTIPKLRREFRRHGFQAAVYGFDGGPAYLTFSRFAYALGYLHQQMAPALIRPIILAFGRKLEGDAAA
jgi:SAM-dependent methyltransferase